MTGIVPGILAAAMQDAHLKSARRPVVRTAAAVLVVLGAFWWVFRARWSGYLATQNREWLPWDPAARGPSCVGLEARFSTPDRGLGAS